MSETTGTETKEQVIPPVVDDAEARIAALESEKAVILEREANYKAAYLKEVGKKKEVIDPDESEDDKIRRITREELAKTAVARIDTEKELLLKKLAKENKELKLALKNKTDIPASTITDTEGQKVKDTLITPDQEKYFKTVLKWSDKEITAYKKKLVK